MKKENNTLIFLKYDPLDKSTHFNEIEYYKKIAPFGNKRFMLTNGINIKFEQGQSGSNNAITEINPHYFDFTDYNIIHNTNDIEYDNNISEIINKWRSTVPRLSSLNNLHAGTIVFTSLDTMFRHSDKVLKKNTAIDHLSYNNYIHGVYHIHGIGWNRHTRNNNHTGILPEVNTIQLVKEYYRFQLILKVINA
jgi:hypothetical protein